MIVISVLSTVLCLAYAILIIWLCRQLVSYRADASHQEQLMVSVVIAFRNEQENLSGLMADLKMQDYPRDLYEVVLVNDHSTDQGEEVVRNFMADANAKIKLINADKEGKKAAIELAWKHCSGKYLLQTDADCRLPLNWISSMMKHVSAHALIMGPVVMKPLASFWSGFAALEFLSLQATGFAFAIAGRAFMGSAANMAYHSSLLNSDIPGKHRKSGDDVFLIQKANRTAKVGLVINKAAAVETPAPKNMREFVSQRARWGGKATAYKSGWAMSVAILISLISVWQVFLLLYSLYSATTFFWFLSVLVIKGIVDFILLKIYADRTGQSDLLRLFPMAAMLYPFYILVTGIVILFVPVSWKNRSFRPITD